MRGVIIERFGSPEVLQYRELADPVAGPGEAVIEVHAVSVNRTLDVAVRANGDNRDPELPLVLGSDPSGIVTSVGAGVQGVEVGDRVAARSPIPCGVCTACRQGRDCDHRLHLGIDRWGGYAEAVSVPVAALVPLPPNLDFPEATVVARHYPTAFYLAKLAGLRPGEIALVTGATGGLGSALLEAARLAGATVVAGLGSDAKAEVASKMGADHTVNYRQRDLTRAVGEVTDGAGADVVFENSGDPLIWPQAFASLARHGRLVTAGAHAGRTVELDLRRLYRLRLQVIGGAGSDQDSLDRALAAAAAGQLHPLVGELLPLHEARRAHELVERGEVIGKVILQPCRSDPRSGATGLPYASGSGFETVAREDGRCA